MRKLILSFLIGSLFVLGNFSCAPENPGSTNNPSPAAEGKYQEKPGFIEAAPSEITYMIEAKEKMALKDDVDDYEVALLYYRPNHDYEDWALWVWGTGGDGATNFAATSAAGFSTVTLDGGQIMGYMKFNNKGTSDNGCIPLVAAELGIIKDLGVLNFIVRQKDDWVKDPGDDQNWSLSLSKVFGVISGGTNVYAVEPDAKPQIGSAVMVGVEEIRVALSQRLALEIVADSNGFIVECEDGTTIKAIDAKMYLYRNVEKREKNFTKDIWLKIEPGMDFSKKWYLKRNGFLPEAGVEIKTGTPIKMSVSALEYTGDDLGLTLSGSTATFKVWAPLASEVNVLLYSTWQDASTDVNKKEKTVTDTLTGATSKRHAMTLDKTTGLYSVADVNVAGLNYYNYEIVNLGAVVRVADMNSKVCGPDSISSQLMSIDDPATKPVGWSDTYENPWSGDKYNDAVIYEMHIRDWSRAFVPDSTGRFDEITDALADGQAFSEHLKDLGVTHVQIVPIFDYAERNNNMNYNWGYNPYHYNVPEGRYTNNPENGGQEAVKQMRAMIQAFHDAGIAVNMDVVYNHTNGTGLGSIYDMTVPYYYYRLSNGSYSNGSGCGNETDSEAKMFKKYIIESVKHWVENYHINGFRFDLMGLHSIGTMGDIYKAVALIDPKIMVYGEPWTGGSSPVVDGIGTDKKNIIDTAVKDITINGVGMFNDDFRNAIKGAEFGGFKGGQVQGVFNDIAIVEGLKGSPKLTKVSGRSLNYVECHDNYTLFDKLSISMAGGTSQEAWKAFSAFNAAEQATIIAQNKLSAAYVFLAQGTPFINGGQEFMRTKKGDENSYSSADEFNEIDLGFKTTYSDVYYMYKALIAIRKTYDAFTAATATTAETVSEGFTKYGVSGINGNFIVYFNASEASKVVNDVGEAVLIDETDGTYSLEASASSHTVSKKGFLIIKK